VSREVVICLHKVGTCPEKVVMCLYLKGRKRLSVYMGYVSRESGYVSTQSVYVSRERGSVSLSQRKKVVIFLQSWVTRLENVVMCLCLKRK